MDFDAHTLEQPVGILFDQFQGFGLQDLDRRQRPGQERDALQRPRCPGGLACGPAAAATGRGRRNSIAVGLFHDAVSDYIMEQMSGQGGGSPNPVLSSDKSFCKVQIVVA